MIDHGQIVLAARTHALTLSVCTTGTTTLAATATGYTRETGSFLDDGLRAGMELTPAGFSDTTRRTIEKITDTVITVIGAPTAQTAQTAASGRSLSVAMPQAFLAENVALTPVRGVPYVVEGYLGGSLRRITNGPLGTFEALPLYTLRFACLQGVGPDACRDYADAVIRRFAPSTALTLANGDVARVRGDLAPFPGQILTIGDRASITVTIPLRIRSTNLL